MDTKLFCQFDEGDEKMKMCFVRKFSQIVLFGLICFLFTSVSAETLELKNKNEINDAINLNNKINMLSTKVMACIENNNGKTQGCICSNECSCKFKGAYLAAKNAYTEVINQYPSWSKKIIFFKMPNDPAGYNLNLAGLEKQFSTSCSE